MIEISTRSPTLCYPMCSTIPSETQCCPGHMRDLLYPADISHPVKHTRPQVGTDFGVHLKIKEIELSLKNHIHTLGQDDFLTSLHIHKVRIALCTLLCRDSFLKLLYYT